jgi:integrase
MLHRRLDAAGLPRASLHSLRHGWTADKVQQNMPITYITATGGWTNSRMVNDRYGQYAVQERALEAMKALLDR